MDKLHWEQALARADSQPAQALESSSGDALPDYSHRFIGKASPRGPVILLANSLLDAQPGARVLQAVRLGDGSMLLLDLGWLAQGKALPSVVLPPFPAGQWLPWHARWTLPGAQAGTAGQVDALDMAALQHRYPGHWRNGVLALQAPLPGLRPWPVQPPISAQRHFAYAVQWLLLGGCLAWQGLRWSRR